MSSRSSPGRRLAVGIALVLLADGAVLVSVARNRLSEPDSRLQLTEGALRLNVSYAADSSRRSLRFALRSEQHRGDGLLSWSAPRPGDDWLDRAKLTELGFSTELDPAAPEAEHFYAKALPRRTYLVLGVDEAGEGTDLRVVDARLDAVALRRRYPDRSRYAITRGDVRLLRGSDYRLRGLVELFQNIQVPRRFSGARGIQVMEPFGWSAAPGSRRYRTDRALMPLYRATVAFGGSYSPWLTDLEDLTAAESAGLITLGDYRPEGLPTCREIRGDGEPPMRIRTASTSCLEDSASQVRAKLEADPLICDLRIQTAEVSAESDDLGWAVDRSGRRVFSTRVDFERPFGKTPELYRRIDRLRWEGSTAAGWEPLLRQNEHGLTATGFTYTLEPVDGNRVDEITTQWIAFEALVGEECAAWCPPQLRRIEGDYRVTEDRVPGCLESTLPQILATRPEECVRRRESGKVSADSSTLGWGLHRGTGGGEQVYSWQVRFETAFDEPPQIYQRPTSVKVARDDPPTPLEVGHQNITPEGFDLFVRVGGEAHLWAVEVAWMALEMSPEAECRPGKGFP